ncbi:MAG: hypothetical protein R3F13_05530 [Prosthecobacter sp.]
MFDPTKPANNAPNSSAEMRAQLNGLKDLIDAILTITDAQVDGVNTVGPGSPANASVSVVGNTLHFGFDIPQGANGADGMAGSNGSDGAQGPPGNDGSPGEPGPMGETGPQGPPFATAVVDSVSTLDPWENATVDATFDGTNVHFTFGIPRGNDGSNGADGANGSDGSPGEVSQQQLDDAISGTSANTNGVNTLDHSYADTDAEELRQKVNELINALRR